MKGKRIALITGASSGIGYELSKLFAQDGYHVVLVARNEQRLEELAVLLKEKCGTSVTVIPKDLSAPTSADEIFTELQGQNVDIDILVNNAGTQVYGPFAETDLKKQVQLIQTHLITLTQLTRLFLPQMIERKFGRILNVGSTGSFTPGPLNSVYCATKAYVLSFSEAIAEELKDTGVSVTALCPGPTATEFAKRAQIEDTRIFSLLPSMSASKVAQIGYRGLMKKKRVIIPGILNKLQISLVRFTPRIIVTKIVKFQMSK